MDKESGAEYGAFMEKFILGPLLPHPISSSYHQLPLNGLTFAVKDIFDVEGRVSGFGNPDWVRTRPVANSTASTVLALLKAGATCVGKTVMDEMAYSINGENIHYGTPRNPYAPDRVPGGSSSGSAKIDHNVQKQKISSSSLVFQCEFIGRRFQLFSMSRRRDEIMTWRIVGKSGQALAAHGLLFTFTLLLVFKLDHVIYCSWWMAFSPLWLFHAVVARGRFSLPAPLVPRDRHWAPCHAIVAIPLLIAFELLLCIYLETIYVHGVPAVNLRIVFLPLLAFETVILVDNMRMCRALIPGYEGLSDEAIWETLPHFWVAISMVFFLAATLFTLLKLCGDIRTLGWWDLFINFGIAEFFAFLVCTKWSNPMIHRSGQTRDPSSSSRAVRWTDGLTVQLEEQNQDRMCGLQDTGGHIMKIPIIVFQILLCMCLEGTPPSARYIPLPVLFIPIFLLQGAGVLFASSHLVEKIVLLRQNGACTGQYFIFSSRVCECLAFMHHGSRLLGWWSIDEGSCEEQARIFHAGGSGYHTFCDYPPEIVKKMPKKDLSEEVWRLQAALIEQTEITKISQQEHERLQNEKVLCRVCFEREISVVLLPCRHRILCSSCCKKCKKCPICRVCIDERLPVYDV